MPIPDNPESLRHPFYDYSLFDALKLARSLEHGPRRMLGHELPLPDAETALATIRHCRKETTFSQFNWITGRVAEELLMHACGFKVTFQT